MANLKVETKRPRGGSVSEIIHNIETDHDHHLTGAFAPGTPIEPTQRAVKRKSSGGASGFFRDIITLRWMVEPASSLKLLIIPIVLWVNWKYLSPHHDNPFEPLLFVSHYLPDSKPDDPRFKKGPLDLLFIAYYVLVWSFVRQGLTIHILRPLARYLGLKKAGKLDRFAEQGYAFLYFSFFGTVGFLVMSKLPTWWYRTEYFWIDFPHWRMSGLMKRYYLMQLAYWVQQLLVLILRLEKPRKDFTELVIHHFVTLWLVGWSYYLGLNYIGNAVFLTMDVSDVFLALSKLLNYLGLEKTSAVSFAFFTCVWTYLRHYLNIVILWSVWTQYDLIPEAQRQWFPLSKDIWMVWWMKYQVFVPILLLQGVNLFWYVLILRILYRAIFTDVVADERSDDEDDGEDEGPANEKKNK